MASRPRPKGEVGGSGLGVSRPRQGGWGGLGPDPGGGWGVWLGGVQAHT